MQQPHVRRAAPAPAHRALAVLAALAVLCPLGLVAAPAAEAAEPRMALPETTVLHVHLLQSGGTAPAAPGTPRALPAAVQRAAGAVAAEPGRALVLLGSAVLATTDKVDTRIAGPAGLPAALSIDTSGRTDDRVHVRRLQVAASLEGNRQRQLLLDTSATLRLGEAVVAGTSYLGPELGTLIVVVEARAAGGG